MKKSFYSILSNMNKFGQNLAKMNGNKESQFIRLFMDGMKYDLSYFGISGYMTQLLYSFDSGTLFVCIHGTDEEGNSADMRLKYNAEQLVDGESDYTFIDYLAEIINEQM